MRLVPANTKKQPGLYYGATCTPSVKGFVWECASREEYLGMRGAFEEDAGNCNTCRHLVRVPHEKQPDGFMPGRCARNPVAALRFHPDDMLRLFCWQGRRDAPVAPGRAPG